MLLGTIQDASYHLIYKTLHGMRPSYLRDCLFLVVSVQSVRANRVGMLEVPLNCHFSGSGKYSFSVVAHVLWNKVTLNYGQLVS